MAYENLMKNKKLSSQTGASSLIKPNAILQDSGLSAYEKLQQLANVKERQKATQPERTYSTERPKPVTKRESQLSRGAGLTGSEQRDKGIIQPTTRLNINDVFKPKTDKEQWQEAYDAYTRLVTPGNTDEAQRSQDANTVDLYVNRGLTGTERREKKEDAARAEQKAELERNRGLTGTERLAPQRELEAKKKGIEAERADMYANPQNYFDTSPVNYAREMVAKNFEYDAKIAEVDNQLTNLRMNSYDSLSLEDDFWQNVRKGEQMPTADKEQVEGTYSNFDLFTEDEKNIYNYLLAKQGEQAAHDYYEFNRANAQYRYGQRVANAIDEKKGVGKAAALTANALGTGVASWMEGVLGSVSPKQLPESGLNYASQAIKDDLGVGGGMAYDVGVTVGNMLPSIFFAAISGPALAAAGMEASAAANIAGKIGSATLGLSASGNAYQQGLREGMTRDQALWYGTLVGVSEAALQNVMHGVGKLSGIQTGVVANNIKLIENGMLRFMANVGNSAVHEGTEEALQAILEPMYRTILTGEDLNIDWSEVAYNGLMGAFTGGAFESVGAAQTELDRRNSFTELANTLGGENQAMVSSLVAAMDYAEGSRTRQLGTDLSNALQGYMENGDSAAVRQFLNNNRKHFNDLAYFMKEEADKVVPAEADPVRNGTMGRIAAAESATAEASGVEAKTKVMDDVETRAFETLTKQGLNSEESANVLETITRIVKGDNTLSNNEIIKAGISKDKRIRAALNELTGSNLDTSKNQQGAGETKTQMRQIIERMAARNSEVKAEPLDVATADAVIAAEEMHRAEMAAAEVARMAENVDAAPVEQSGAAKFMSYAKPATEAEIQPLSGSVKSEGNVYSGAEVRAIANEEGFTDAETEAMLSNFGEMAKAEGIDYESNPEEFIRYSVARETNEGVRTNNVSAEQRLTADILRVALADKGVKDVVLVSGSPSMVGANGRYENGVVYVNADKINNRTYSGIVWTVGHEIVHHAERSGTNLRQNGVTVANAPIVNEIFDVMTQLARSGAIRGEYARMAIDPKAMEEYINRKIEAQVAFLTKSKKVNGKTIPGMTEEAARRAFNKFDARAEIAADFLGALMGVNSAHAAEGRVGSKYGPVDLFAKMDESEPGLLKQIRDFVTELRDSVKAMATRTTAERNAKANTQRMLTKLSRTLGEAMDKVAAASEVKAESNAETEAEVEGEAKSERDSGNLNPDYAEAKFSVDEGKVDSSESLWNEQVSHVIDGKLPSHSAMYLKETPEILQELGFFDLPMTLTQKHFMAALNGTNEKHPNPIPETTLRNLPQLLREPVAVIGSNTHPQESIMVITSGRDVAGNPVVVAVKSEGSAEVIQYRGTSNHIVTIYGANHLHTKTKNGGMSTLERAAEEGQILYINKKRSQELYQADGFQLPRALGSLDFDTIIRKWNGFVNKEAPKREAKNIFTGETIKWSADDSAYMAAVERGDTEAAQKMVDEAAKAAGYTVKGYHGTTNLFTVFDTSKSNVENDWGRGIYASTSLEDVETNYASEDGADLTARIERLADMMENWEEYEDMDYEQRIEAARKQLSHGENRVLHVAFRMEKPVIVERGYKGTFFTYESQYDEDADEYSEPSGTLIDIIEEMKRVLSNEYEWFYREDGKFDELYMDAIDYGGLSAAELQTAVKEILVDVSDEDGNLVSDEILRKALENIGYDGIVDKTVPYKFGELSGRRNGGMQGVRAGTTHFIAFDPTQVKLTDPVTYDDAGNVIPLSERFNAANDDIRFSVDDALESDGNEVYNPLNDTKMRGGKDAQENGQRSRDVVHGKDEPRLAAGEENAEGGRIPETRLGYNGLRENQKAAVRRAVDDEIGTSTNDETFELIGLYLDDGLEYEDAIAEIAQRVFDDYVLSPVVAERNWARTFEFKNLFETFENIIRGDTRFSVDDTPSIPTEPEVQLTPEQRRELERAEALRRVFRTAREMYGEGEEFISRMEADTKTQAGRERLRQVFRPQTEQARAEQRTQDDLRLQRERDKEAERRLAMRKAFNLEKEEIKKDARAEKMAALIVQKEALDEKWKERMDKRIERIKEQAADRLRIAKRKADVTRAFETESAKIREGKAKAEGKRKLAEEREANKERLHEQRVLSRKSAKEARAVLSTSRNTDRPDYGNSDVDTLRQLPEDDVKTNKISELAQKLRAAGKRAYASFVNQAQAIDNFSKRQGEGVKAGSLVNMVYGDAATIETIFQEGLVGRDGRRMGDSMKTTMLVWDEKGNVDVEKQNLLQDYMLHVHNIDRMSFTEKALAKVEELEAQHPWLVDIPAKDFAYAAALNVTETEATGTEQRQKIVREYASALKALKEAKDKPIFADADGKPVSAETSRAIVADYEAKNDWLKPKAQGIYQWWEDFMTEWAVGSTLSAEDYAMWKELYPHYVPTYREGDKTNSPVVKIGGTSAQLMDIFKGAKGSTRPVRDITDSFSMLVTKIVDTSRKNELFRNIIDTALLDDTGEFSDFAIFDWDGYYEANAEYADAMKLGAMLNGDDVAAIEKGHAEAMEEIDGGYRITAFSEDGGRISAWLSKELYRSLAAVTATDKLLGEGTNVLTKMGSKLTNPMKAMITGYNPHFALRNALRDLPSAIVNSASGLAFPKYYGEAWKQMVSNSEEWNRFKALGGTHFGYYGMSVDWAKRMGEKKGLGGKAKDILGTANEATESVTRFAEYLATIAKLGDSYEARVQGIKNAAEVTVDFSRKGEYGKLANAWIPYWNPAVQGIDKVFRQIFSNGTTVKQKFAGAGITLTRAAIIAVLPELLQYLMLKLTDRYDDWEKASDRMRDSYFLIPVAGKNNENKFFKIPKTREWGTILGTPLMRMLESANGRSDPFDNYVEDALLANFSISGVEDAIGLGTFIDLKTNKDFAGRDIVPYAYQEVSPSLQYDSDTSVLAYGVAGAYNNTLAKLAESLGVDAELSPMQLDYIMSDYFGDFYSTFFEAVPVGLFTGDVSIKAISQTVLAALSGSWVGDNRYSNYYVGEYFDALDSLEQGVANEKLLNPDGYKSSYIYKLNQAFEKKFGERMAELNKSAAELPDGEEKDNTKDEISALAIEAVEWLRSEYANNSDDPLLRTNYENYSPALQDALIELDGYSGDYHFKPSPSSTKTYTDPNSKRKEYILTDEQYAQYKTFYYEVYNELMSKAVNSRTYKSGDAEERAQYLEEVRDEVHPKAKEMLFDWLRKNGVKSTYKED